MVRNGSFIRLGDIAQTAQGGKLKLSGKHFVEIGYPAYGAGGLNGLLEVAEFDEPGIVLSSIGARCGKCFLAEGQWTSMANTRLIFPDLERVDIRFLWYQLNDEERWPRSGAAQPFIRPADVKDHQVFLPALEEQRRIVAVLDEAFDGLARARENTEANLASARELFENALSNVLHTKGRDWPDVTLGEVYDVRDGTHDSPKYQTQGWPLITSKNLARTGLHFEKVKFISERDFEAINKRSKVDRGDVLFAMIGTIGNPTLIELEPDFAIKNVALFKMKNGRQGALLRHVLNSKGIKEAMLADAKGTTQKFVGLGYLRAFKLKLPPPEQEAEVLSLLDRWESGVNDLEKRYSDQVNDLDHLRQSLLQKAFAGDLT